MAQKDDTGPGAQSKNPGKGSLFIQKRPLDKGEKKKLIKNVLDMNDEFRSHYEKWETATDAFSRRVEISIARLQAYIQEEKNKPAAPVSVAPEKLAESGESGAPEKLAESGESGAPEKLAESGESGAPEKLAESGESGAPEKSAESAESGAPERSAELGDPEKSAELEDSAASEKSAESEDYTSPDIDDEKAATKGWCKKWSDDLKKITKEQRQKTRKCAEKWLGYLHRFDYKEEKVEPTYHFSQYCELYIQVVVIILCLVWTITSFSPEVTAKCEKGFFICSFERALGFLVGVYNLCLTIYNITIEGTGNA